MRSRREEALQQQAERHYAEDLGVILSSMGMPPVAGKLLGWLLVCDPSAQSNAELAAALEISKASVSTGMRLLERAQLARRVPMPAGRGQARGHRWELTPDPFVDAIDIARYRKVHDAMERGLDVLADEPPERAKRVREARDFYAFIIRELPKLLDRYRAERAEPTKRAQRAETEGGQAS